MRRRLTRAEQETVSQYMPLACRLATTYARYTTRDVLSDLRSAALEALCLAVISHDSKRSVFPTYASFVIRRYLRRELNALITGKTDGMSLGYLPLSALGEWNEPTTPPETFTHLILRQLILAAEVSDADLRDVLQYREFGGKRFVCLTRGVAAETERRRQRRLLRRLRAARFGVGGNYVDR